MTFRHLAACVLAVVALAGCNKTSGPGDAATTDDSKVTITQANPPPGGTWADVVNATSAGFVMGNPNAKVKLVEIGSLSCPHCKEFEEQGSATLVNTYVKSGNVSWEFRPYVIHGALDVANDLVARCNGPSTFFPLVNAFYADQDMLLNKINAVPQDKLEQVQNLPPKQVFVAMANLVGLQDWAAARGLPQAKSNQCLSDEKMIDREVQMTSDVESQYPDFKGTPSFILNGTLLADLTTWAKLEPHLKDALK
ncbi:MAG: thioredoxin domain-containing protein [Sphingomicrobium sp.]